MSGECHSSSTLVLCEIAESIKSGGYEFADLPTKFAILT